MTAQSTTPEFITYEAVYLPKNHFIKEESMTMVALVMTMSNQPQAVTMSFQREYAEPCEWLVQNFTDQAFLFSPAFCINYIELLEKSTLVWNFHSLLLAIQMMFRFMQQMKIFLESL